MKAAPSTLDAPARRKWKEIFPILEARGDFDQAAADALTAYCAAWSQWVAANAKVAELGTIVKSPAGFPVANPYLAVAAAAQRQLRQWAGELRLTPKTRKAPKKADPEKAGLINELLKRGSQAATARN